ncbi:MAG: shikimate dehydrogenase, partial [Archaeoglobaceae archaeon]
LKDKTALVIGAGGAGKAIAIALLKMGATVVMTNRTVSRGLKAVDLLRSYGKCIFYPMEKIHELKVDIIANATPIGMEGFPGIPIKEEILKEGMIVFDAVYNPIETQLIKKAIERGCMVINGLEMFVYQAAKAFEIWTGIKPNEEIIRETALKALKVQKKSPSYVPGRETQKGD